jgi:hypothetical protein
VLVGVLAIGYAYSASSFRIRLRFRESEQEWGNNYGKPSWLRLSAPTRRSLPPLYAPALWNKGHSLRRVAPTLGIGVGTWICLDYMLCAERHRLSESESEPESACTIRVPLDRIQIETFFHRIICHLWPVWFCHILPHYLINSKVFVKKIFLNIKCVFWFPLQILSETFLILRIIQQDIIIKVSISSFTLPVINDRF